MYNVKELINNLSTDWKKILNELYDKDTKYFIDLENYLNTEFDTFGHLVSIYPDKNLIFEAFNKFNFSELKIVILGQDPYHGPEQAMGLCFSVPEGLKIPPSLKRIFKEINCDLSKNCNTPERDFISGDLTYWSKQGILLLNTALTVRQSKPNSHSKIWKKFTEKIITYISENSNNTLFILWGNNAKYYKNFTDLDKHKFLEGVHPSPLSGNKWVGCNHFSKANAILKKLGKSVINW